ncbi:phosphoribosylglycinamide formyltransferase [Lutispora thermophila]|uniref:Phosphoribosylglycinamide formyltransferase n=1 Tax=Lutispora thermophila DSM 19022 TaxID=1122184 RepID=A0A1M6AXJ7_9FIRM|nr:phosphoribosylglycinamide formyltransferase [Lutispora thermophila]SHI41205.1 formyltetrahydrofolate-dependent phosphoribosylglycinamide formyltransferase [Lutispora thermophila DSM 19022]
MQKVRIGVLISGGGSNLQALIDNVENGYINGEIVMVISDKKGVYGIERARKHGINAVEIDKKEFEDRNAFMKAIINELERHKVELVVLAGFLSILSQDVIERYRNRIMNTHPSLIPAFCGKGYYGYRVHKAVLEYGAKVSGATVHFVDEGTDTGPIILQEAVKVEDDDTPETLAARILSVEHKLLPQAVKLYCEGKLMVEGRKVVIKTMN